MIPVSDVESELLKNPGVEDVALTGYPENHGGELACAVLVPATEPPITLDELRKYLTDQGMTEWYLPSRVEYVEALPRNGNGKVRKELLPGAGWWGRPPSPASERRPRRRDWFRRAAPY